MEVLPPATAHANSLGVEVLVVRVAFVAVDVDCTSLRLLVSRANHVCVKGCGVPLDDSLFDVSLYTPFVVMAADLCMFDY